VTINVPWQPRTPQEGGRLNEGKVLRQYGARQHPGSGSGRIAFDGSTEGEVIEVKTVAKSHTLSLAYVRRLFNTAVRQGKEPVMVIDFPGYRVILRIERTKGN
jgi:hypothetical protein